jgi:site-specific DNA-methyltransferase (adenine-specific)
LLYRDKLPKFNNGGKMVFNVMDWVKDSDSEKIHPTQKPVGLLKTLIQIFTDEGDVVIDPVAGSGSTLVAASECNRKAFGFEIKKDFFAAANEWIKRTEAQGMLFKDAARNARRREQGRIEEFYASE